MLDLNKEAYLKTIRERQRSYEKRLSSGSIDSLEEYKLVVGKIQGLEEAALVINKICQDVLAGRELKNEIVITHVGGINTR